MLRHWVVIALTVAVATSNVLLMARRNASAGTNRALYQRGTPERFWIAARHDATRLVTYFETVHFGTMPTRDNQLVQSRTPDFFGPRPIAADELERVRPPAGEPFRIGDQYDVLTADGGAVSMMLTSFVKFHTDEGVGNDSYIGALGRVSATDLARLGGNYFVVRRRDGPATARGSRAELVEAPRPPSAVAAKLLAIVGGRLLIAAQPFTTAAGEGRQLIIANVGSGRECRTRVAWLTGQSESRVLGTEDMPFCGSTLYAGLRLRAVVDMGNGRTGLVIVLSAAGGRAVKLVEYLDGAKLADMRVWQVLSVGD